MMTRSGYAFLGLLLAGGVLHAQHDPLRRGFHDPCATIPPGALPAPNGSSVRAWFGKQAALAEEDDFVIYSHEWYMGGIQLGPYGQYHVSRIIHRLPSVPFAVILQVDGKPDVILNRRLVIVNALLHAGITDAEQRVVVDFPKAEGLRGDEIPRVFQRGVGGRGSAGGQGNFLPSGGLGSSGFGGQGGFGDGGLRGGLRGSLGGGLSGY